MQKDVRCKKRLWRERGREQLESFQLMPWASRGRHDLLHLLNQLNPMITELTQAIEQEAEVPRSAATEDAPWDRCVDRARLCSDHWEHGTLSLRQTGRQLRWAGSFGRVQRKSQ